MFASLPDRSSRPLQWMFDVLELWPRAMGLAKETRTAVRADARDEVICANYVPASAKAKLPVPFVRANDLRDDIESSAKRARAEQEG